MDDDSRGFVSAFTRAVRPDDDPGHFARRLLVIVVAGVLAVALAALLLGAFGHKATAAATSAGAADPSSWTAVAGPGCTGAGARFTAAAGSTAYRSGGYRGDGCEGEYFAVPVSGSAASYDPARLTLWTFAFASKYTSCQVATYVPDNPDITRVGGDPAYYYVYAAKYAAGSTAKPLAVSSVPQVSKLGRWVTNGTYAVTTGTMTVALLNTGVDGTVSTRDAHVAAAEVRLSCHEK
jgi:hypothetical protein